MGYVILLVSFGVPLVIVAGLLIWFLGKPVRDMQKLQARAAAGDRDAQAAVARVKGAESAVRRAVGGEDPARARLLSTGSAARAVILDVRPLGVEIESGPVPARIVEVVLSLEGSGMKVTVQDAVSELHLGRLLKGANVPVRIDPADPEHVIVLWDTL
jgi:hypothetical protein